MIRPTPRSTRTDTLFPDTTRFQSAGYVDYHAMSGSYELSTEHALVLSDEESPFFIPQARNVPAAMWYDEDKALADFRTGGGVAWGEHHGRMSCGVTSEEHTSELQSLMRTSYAVFCLKITTYK